MLAQGSATARFEEVEGRGDSSESVPVIVLTHTASESAVRAALERIDEFSDVTAATRVLRIEEEL